MKSARWVGGGIALGIALLLAGCVGPGGVYSDGPGYGPGYGPSYGPGYGYPSAGYPSAGYPNNGYYPGYYPGAVYAPPVAPSVSVGVGGYWNGNGGPPRPAGPPGYWQGAPRAVAPVPGAVRPVMPVPRGLPYRAPANGFRDSGRSSGEGG